MPYQTEPSANFTLGRLLQRMLSRSKVHSENTQAIAGHPGLRPDVLVITPGAAPVVVEAEFEPAASVEDDAKARLGLEVASNGRVIEAVIALRYPEHFKEENNLRAALRSARLSYCIFTEESDGAIRFPSSGWLEGSVEDLADMVRLVSVPQRAVDAATMAMEQGIDRVAAMLDEMDKSRPAINMNIARLLGMTNVPQMRRMACAIIVNAMVFHDRIAGMHPEISPLRLVCGPGVSNPEAETLEAWSKILNINYWPIFSIAADILNQLPSDYASLHRRGVSRNRRRQRSRPDRANLPKAHHGPQVPGDLLHAAGVRGAAGAAGGGENGGRGLERRRGDRQTANRGLRLRHRCAALGGLRAGSGAPRASGGRSSKAAQGNDGGGALRLRRDAVCGTHHRLYLGGRSAPSRTLRIPPLPSCLRTTARPQCQGRLARTADFRVSNGPLQHQRPEQTHRQHRRGDRLNGGGGGTARQLRPGDHESTVHEGDRTRWSARRCGQPSRCRFQRYRVRPDGHGKSD